MEAEGLAALTPAPGWFSSRPRPLMLAGACATVALVASMVAPSKPRDAIGLLVAAAMVLAVLIRPLIGAVLLVALVPVTSGLASGFPVSHVRLSEVVIGAVGVTLIMSTRRRDAVPWQTLDWILLSYGICWAVFGVAADVTLGQHLSIDAWGTVLGQLQFFLVYRGIRVAVRTERDRRLAVGALILASVPATVVAILQEMRAPGVGSFVAKITGGLTGGTTSGPTGGLLRATGPFDNWAALAGYLLPVLLVLVALALARTQVRHRRWYVAAGVLAAVALALTDEQSAIVCLIAGLVLLVRHYDHDGRITRWVLLGVAVVLVLASPVLVTRLFHELSGSPGTGRIPWVPQTLSFRWSVWTRQYLPAIGARPLTGYGMVLPPSISWAYPESQYISFLIEGGLPMLMVFAALAWAMLSASLAATRNVDPFVRALGRALTIAVASMVVMNFTWPFLSNGGMPQVLWGLMALTVPGGIRAGMPKDGTGGLRVKPVRMSQGSELVGSSA